MNEEQAAVVDGSAAEEQAVKSAEELAEAKLARRRAQVAASKRKRRQWRKDAGRCPECGKERMAGRSLCRQCVERAEARDRRWVAREAEKRRVEREQARRAAAPPVCTKCGGTDLVKWGVERGRQKYRCRGCGCQTIGYLRRVADARAICPYCKGRCQKAGTADTVRSPWRQRYLCTACGRSNTNLWPADAPSPGGPFPHRVTLGLNYAAREGLVRYCQARKLTMAQAIREIFARAAEPSPVLRAGHYSPWRPEEIEQLPPGGVRLPDGRAEAARKLGSQTGEARGCPTVLVLLRVSVALNDRALAGLVRAMRLRGLQHQDAARALLAEARAQDSQGS